MQKGFSVILVLVVIALLVAVGGVAYYFGKQSAIETLPKQNKMVDVKLVSPSATPLPSDETANWKTYEGKYISFKYPNEWNPTVAPEGNGSILETLKFGIPGVISDQFIGFSSVDYNLAVQSSQKPEDLISSTSIKIGGKDGVKWFRKGQGSTSQYVTYNYLTTGYKEKGSFEIGVTLGQEDKKIEKQLDQLVNLIIFK